MAHNTGKPAGEGLREVLEISAKFDAEKHDYIAHVGPGKDERVRFTVVDNAVRVKVPISGKLPYDADVHGVPRPPESLADALFSRIVVPNNHNSTVHLGLAPTFRSQLYGKLGRMVWPGTSKGIPADFADSIPPKVQAGLFNGLADELADKQEWMVRAYQDVARALVHGGRNGYGAYPRFWNTEIVDLIAMAFDEDAVRGGGTLDPRLILSNVDPDSLYLRVIWHNVEKVVRVGDRDVTFHGGFAVSHRETGDGSFTISPALWNPQCTNTFQVESMNTLKVFHAGSKRSKMVQVKAAIGEALRITPRLVNLWIEAENDHLEDFSDILLGLSIKEGWDLKSTMAVSQPTNDTPFRTTRAGLADLITDASQRIAKDYRSQVEMDKLAGAILSEPGSIFSEARRLARDASRMVEGRGGGE